MTNKIKQAKMREAFRTTKSCEHHQRLIEELRADGFMPTVHCNECLDLALAAVAASGSPPAMPTRWWCESCGAVMSCTTENGDIICEHKHIVAACIPEIGASSGSTGAPEQEDRERLWTLFAMKGGWVEPSAFADDVLNALRRA